ncbi:WD repeat-containing protein 70-like [Antedon mediterranea]|uniref:WD repeat-containing protein 70-like n=1 Tax=Antedon mediterranea TaxID=105859 RepID=UPI003AF4E961
MISEFYLFSLYHFENNKVTKKMSDEEDAAERRRLREARLNQLKAKSNTQQEDRETSRPTDHKISQQSTTDVEDFSNTSEKVAEMMGFQGFGKKARTFNVMAMFEETKRAAQEVNRIRDEEKSAQVANELEKQKINEDSDEEEEDDDLIGPPLPPGFKDGKHENAESDSDDGEESDEDEENLNDKIPSSHEIQLEHGVKPVSAVGLDPSGSRLVSGSYDYNVKFWDFAGMDSSLKSFRSIQPCECHHIKTLQYSMTGDCILVVAGNAQAKVIDRDGFQVMECVSGDRYIVDMVNTKGHIAMLHGGCWNPRVKEEFITCSDDGTVRKWDFNQAHKQLQVIKFKGRNGKKTVPTCCVYSRDGKLIGGACRDGSIQLWDVQKQFIRPSLQCPTAHGVGTDTSCLTFSFDHNLLGSRGGDDTLKLWDIRNFRKPVNVATDLSSFYTMTDCMFSPDNKMLITGISVRKDEGYGKLLFYDKDTFDKVSEIQVTNSSVVRCLWHPKLNQIVVGCANGQVKMYYHPDKSHKGAKLCLVKKKRKVKELEFVANQHVITPHTLRMYRNDSSIGTAYKKGLKDRMDPVKSRKPEAPLTEGTGGRVIEGGRTLSSYVSKMIAVNKFDDSNPREAILKHAKEAAENPYWIAPAYAKSQPTPIFQEVSDEEESDEPTTSKKQKLGT